VCTLSTSHVKLTSYVRMLAKTNTTRVPGKSYCPGDNMCLGRTLVARSNKGKADPCEPPNSFRTQVAGAVRLGSGPHKASPGLRTPLLSATAKNSFMVWIECVSHVPRDVPWVRHWTPHTHTHTHTPQTCEGADLYAACAYYPVFNVALGNTRPD
jgi:hypothetical protein